MSRGFDDEGGAYSRRREFILASTLAGVAIAAPANLGARTRSRKMPFAKGGSFAHGVSSGMPSARAMTLWTRVSGLDRSSRLTLEVATDKGFSKVVERRQVLADERRDFTVHTRVGGLKPAREYFYRFETRNRQSRVGRFRTLPPAGSRQPVKIGFFSCQSYESGYYTAHAALAREMDLDLVLCLGDYVYETNFYDGPAGRIDRTGPNGDGDVQTLAEYREKYRFYQSDRNLQDMHAAHPFIALWDDHEVEDNYNSDGTSPAQTDPALDNAGVRRRVPFEKRRQNGYRAFFEAMPRLQYPKNRDGIFGTVRMGALADLFLTDQRQYRDPQPCGDALLSPCDEYDEPGRTMLGPRQKAWFKSAVPASKAKWKIWGSQLMVMALDLPANQYANPDQWDGYAAERREILDHFKARGVRNLAVVSGDIHTIFAGNLTNTGRISGSPVGVEFGGGSVSSTGIPEAVNIPPAVLEGLVPGFDPHIKFVDFVHRGYGVITAGRDELTCRIKAVETAMSPTSRAFDLAVFKVQPGTPELELA